MRVGELEADSTLANALSMAQLFEPFGFRDGLSQPVLKSTADDSGTQQRRRERVGDLAEDSVVADGEFILGWPNAYGDPAYAPDDARWRAARPPAASPQRFATHGSYLAVRHILKANHIATANGWTPFVSLQAYYTMIGRDLEHELLPMIESSWQQCLALGDTLGLEGVTLVETHGTQYVLVAAHAITGMVASAQARIEQARARGLIGGGVSQSGGKRRAITSRSGCNMLSNPALSLRPRATSTVVGAKHIWSGSVVYDPEGILSTVPAIGRATPTCSVRAGLRDATPTTPLPAESTSGSTRPPAVSVARP